jgi:hypothetical protein
MILEGKPEGKRPLGRPRRRWVENIKMDLTEIRWDGMDWTDLAQDRDQWRALVNAIQICIVYIPLSSLNEKIQCKSLQDVQCWLSNCTRQNIRS